MASAGIPEIAPSIFAPRSKRVPCQYDEASQEYNVPENEICTGTQPGVHSIVLALMPAILLHASVLVKLMAIVRTTDK